MGKLVLLLPKLVVIYKIKLNLMNQALKIGDYNQVSVLGRGSYAKVVLVTRKGDESEIYAMKVLKKKYIQKRNQEANVMTERHILASVSHPFIVKLYNSFQDSKKLYFILQYCQGGEFFGLLSKMRRLSEQQAKFYISQIVQALDYLHQRNILYRDLKPQNVLVHASGYLKLTDFGLSKLDVLQDTATSISGTPEYLAPEIISRTGHGKPVDWWCLGSILYEMVVGLPPFYCQNRSQLFGRIKYGHPSYPPHLSPELKNLIELLLQKTPQNRLGSRFGADEIRNHPWFTNFDWQALRNHSLVPPYIPNLHSQTDVSHFDKQFTQCEVESAPKHSVSSESDRSYFKFSYDHERENPSQMEPETNIHDDCDEQTEACEEVWMFD